MRINNIKRKVIVTILTLTMVIGMIPTTVFAAEKDGLMGKVSSFLTNLFQDSDKEVKNNKSVDAGNFKVLEIRKGSLTGDRIVNLLNPSEDWVLEKEEDYYLYGEFTNPSNSDTLEICFGDKGLSTYNGVTFFNPPGGTYNAGNIAHDYFDKIISYENFDDPQYGIKDKALELQDGKIQYHIKDSVAENVTVNFAMGMILNDGAIGDKTNIENGITVTVGDTSITSDIKTKGKKQIKGFFNTTVRNAELGKKGERVTFSIGESKGKCTSQYLYESITFDVVYPKNAIIHIGFNGNYDKKSESYGTLSEEKTVVEVDNKITTYKISDGYKPKTAPLNIYYTLEFPTEYFSNAKSLKSTVENIAIKLQDGSNYSNIKQLETNITYNILDTSKDFSQFSAVNRNIYNQSITGTKDYIVTLGGAQVRNNSAFSATPYEKTYEAKYNTTNTAANITHITVPCAMVNINSKKPVVTLMGKDSNGKTIIKSIDNPEHYTPSNKNLENCTYLLFDAAEFGMTTFTGVKADIGAIRKSYTSNSGIWRMDGTVAGAFGHFTTDEVGIQVINTYSLYNTDPAKRNDNNGDLKTTSLATSQGEARVAVSESGKLSIKDGEKVEEIDSIEAGDKVVISGGIMPNSRPTTGNQGGITGNTSIIYKPVIYLTLPQGMSYENLLFKNNNNQELGHIVENISYKNTTGDGVSIYKVTFNEDILLGNYKGDNTATGLQYEITLNTSKSLLTKRYELNNLIGVSAETPIRAMSGSDSSLVTTIEDKYGINGGLNYSGISKSANAGFGLQQLAEINVYNSVSVTSIDGKVVTPSWHTYEESNKNSIATIGANSTGQFKLTIQNTSSVGANGLDIAIPIPKKDTTLGTLFMNSNSGFDMSIEIPDDKQGFEIKYVNLSVMNESGDFKTTDANKDTANAILIVADEVEAKAEHDIIFDFEVKEGTAGAKNIWRNAFSYETLDGSIQHKTGSYVASSVAPGKINGYAFNDKNKNGKKDSGEAGISNVSIVTKDETGKISSVVTDEDGYYEFVAVREEKIELTATVDGDSLYRFNNNNNLETNRKQNFAVVTEKNNDIPLSEYKEVKYYTNSGIGTIPNDKEYISGSSASVAVKPDNLQKQGYNFKEWNTKSDGSGIGYQPGQSFIVNTDTELFAIWEIGKYNIYFNYRGATSGANIVEKILTHNETYGGKEALPIPEKTGCKFGGWSSNPGTNNSYIKNDTVFRTGIDTTLYAVWNPKTDLKVNYNFDGGTGSEESRLVGWQENILPKTNPIKPGYEITGWSYEGTVVTSNDTFESIVGEEKEITLTAIWTAKTGYSISYDLNGGSGDIDDLGNLSWNSKGLIPASNPTKERHIFEGWKLGEAVVTNETSYSSLATNENDKEIVVVAQWAEIQNNTVSYDSDGGNAYSDKNNVLNDTVELLPEVDPIKKGYSFDGWYIGETKVTNETIYKEISGNKTSITLIAKWTAKEYIISYDHEGYESVKVNWNSEIIIPTENPKKAGSVFKGWEYKGIEIKDTDTIKQLIPNDNIDTILLKAMWKDINYTVEYDSDGGTYISPITVTYSQKGIVPEVTPRKIGYKFIGWKSGKNKINKDSTYADLTDGKMVAEWTSKSGYIVEYNTNGDTEDIPSKTNVTWSDKGLLPQDNPIREGYSFVGWTVGRNSVNADTVYGDIATTDSEGSKVTLVAQWTVGSYTVNYNTVGGTIIPSKNVTWDSTNLIPVEIPEKEGYSFLEWQYNGKRVDDNTSYSSLVNEAKKEGREAITLIAAYKKLDTTVGGGSSEDDEEGEEGEEGDNSIGTGTDVQGKVDEGVLVGTYKIDMSWGAMRFKFNTDRVWNPDTHEYEQGNQGVWDTTGFDGINNKISIENHSNGDLEMDFDIVKEGEATSEEDIGAFESVEMKLVRDNVFEGEVASGTILPKVPSENAPAPVVNTYFMLQGEPDNLSLLGSSKYNKMATIVTTFKPAGSSFTPRISK